VIGGAIALARGSPIAGGHIVSPIWTGLGHIKSALSFAPWYFESHYRVAHVYVLFVGLVCFLTAHGVAKTGGVGKGGFRRSHPKAPLVGIWEEKTQDGGRYGVDFWVDGLRVVSYMIGSHRYHSQCWTVLACCSCSELRHRVNHEHCPRRIRYIRLVIRLDSLI
jgi:hypothetical protein